MAYRGSIAHGMYVPPEKPTSIDDKDLMGVCVPGPAVYFGLNGFEQREVKYRRMGLRCLRGAEVRPVCLSARIPMSCPCCGTSQSISCPLPRLGRLLLDNRQVFVSRKAYHSFTGYAYAQLKKMTHLAFKGYMGDKRKQLVEKFGYDTKNAAHLIRLLRMGIEFLREGVLYVDRGVVGDAPNLLSIKNGEWTLDQVKDEADRLFKRAETAYDECKLPRAVDTEKADALCQEIVRMGLGV
jgi:hypothetical protein